MPQGALRRTTCLGVHSGGVKAILENVEVEAAEVFRAESLQGLDHAVELVFTVVGLALGLHLPGHGQRVTVDFQPLLRRYQILVGVEVRGVGEQEAQSVADAAVGFDYALENFV